MDFLRGKVTYLSAFALLCLAAVDAINKDYEGALTKLSAAAAAFGLRRTLPAKGV